jgi:hypothetical protein
MPVSDEKNRIPLEHCFQESGCPSAIQVRAPKIFVSKNALLRIFLSRSVQVHKTGEIIPKRQRRRIKRID